MESNPSTSFQSALMYNLPTVTNVHYHRCNQDKTPNNAGEYCLLTFDYTIDPLKTNAFPGDAQNNGSVNIQSTDHVVAANDFSDSVTVEQKTVTSPFDDPFELYSGSLEFLFYVDMEYTYDITIVIADFLTSYTFAYRLSTALVIMDIKNGGTGVAFGKVAETNNMVEVNPDWIFKAGKISVIVDGATIDLGNLLSQIKQQLGL